MNIIPTENRSRQEVCFRLGRQICPWESQQTWGRICLLGKKCSLRQMMVPSGYPKPPVLSTAPMAWVPKHCLQTVKNGVTQHPWDNSSLDTKNEGINFLIGLTYFITTAAQSAAWASPSFQLLCQTGFEDWSVSDPTLITAASITPQLFFHLSLLMHWCWFSGSKESKVLLITHNGITLIMLMPGACFFPRTHCLLHWQ